MTPALAAIGYVALGIFVGFAACGVLLLVLGAAMREARPLRRGKEGEL